ncbi:MAG: hypothetical protein DSY55_01715 [Clostridia bacterium]|nr:MAG: hypothetical protein DSY55_01715 [Clostridia bacterium]
MKNSHYRKHRPPTPIIIALLVILATAAIAIADWHTINTDDGDIDAIWSSIPMTYQDSTNDSGINDKDEIKEVQYTFDGNALYIRFLSWNGGDILSDNNKRAIAALDCNGNGIFNDVDDRLVVYYNSGQVAITAGNGAYTVAGDAKWGEQDNPEIEWQGPLDKLPPGCRGSSHPIGLAFSIIDLSGGSASVISQADDTYSFDNPIDYGDAKNSYDWTDHSCHDYDTLLLCDGPRHGVTALQLGQNLDADGGDLNDDPALADDNNSTDDEDGVAPSPGVTWGTGGNGSLDVNVSGGSGYLNCWIDWNADEDFLDSGEHIINDQAVAAGDQTISVNVPSGTSFSSPYMARCRVSPNSGEATSPTGAVYGGEVEDNDWLIQPVDLSIAISGSDVALTWSHLGQNDNEQAYRSETPYFDYASATPLGSPGTSGSFTDSGVAGSPADTFYYKVVGTKSVSGFTLHSTPSKEVGLFEFDIVPGS